MLVTVKGYVPHKDAAKILDQCFNIWLKAHADQSGRPYSLDPKFKIHVFERGSVAAAPGAAPAAPAAAGGGTATEDWKTFLPTRPMADENRDNDSMFTVQWLALIKKPADIESERSSVAATANEKGRSATSAPATTTVTATAPAAATATAPATRATGQ
jgi:hypothetical protein